MAVISEWEEKKKQRIKAAKGAAGAPPSAEFVKRTKQREKADECFARSLGVALKYDNIRQSRRWK